MTESVAPQVSVVEQVQLRAAVEPEFRSALLADPRTTLRESGIAVPEQISIRIEESGADEFVLTLPPAIAPGGELEEDVLAGASGGLTPGIVFGVGFVGLWAAINLTDDPKNRAQRIPVR
ncbi:hypothetical protein GIS00_23215 [Nakamurella sp. YIM 132087]|uniref:NHLP leader peptide family natural product n=1 Tax=Nakamurella alba TaxID=2665158 RepID=A0A7K1FRS3_9ACTN|nr:hypothetical protein [Nakamurella alba]MTD16848.1 hypothetical protein [Nakamurella alba]